MDNAQHNETIKTKNQVASGFSFRETPFHGGAYAPLEDEA